MEKKFLLFENFKKEVVDLYTGQDNIKLWYQEKEQKNHPNWPNDPSIIYQDKGWEGWPELVGKENRLKKLSFENFQAEVKKLCPKKTINMRKWYDEEQKNHPNWPSSPYKFYRDKGWQGWGKLVGKN